LATDPEVIEQLRVWAVEFVEAAKEATDRARLNPPRNQLMSAAMLACPDARNWRQVIVPLFRRFGAKPDKKIVDGQAASPSSWKTPFIATCMVW